MQKFWSWLGLNLGRHAGIVSLVGLILTLVLGYGITRLEFATGQDSYLNSDEQIAVDNEQYQELFGGQAMVTLFTMDEGKTVVDLFTSDNVDRIEGAVDEIKAAKISAELDEKWGKGFIKPERLGEMLARQLLRR